ncbi:aminotransferase class I/II-fold pyridoxal phosphate-dependent enzyme [Bacillota bacterium]
MSISKFLIQHANKKTSSFHMPGHKGSAFYRQFGYGGFLEKLVDCDITEIPGADNLFQSEGIIKAVQDRYRDLYGVRNSYLLINGTSGGIIASILAAVPDGGKLIMARNCHKSVFNALTLGAIRPVYAYPEIIPEYGISGELCCSEIERCIIENPEASAVILPSPNYYGVCSDITAISGIVHRYGKVLIVDQAHGAHLKFFKKDMPLSAEDSGADIIINSIHKTLASFTQSAVINLNSDRVDRYALEDKLQSIQSTSPSYLLMASLDINAAILEDSGESVIGQWADNLDYFYKDIEEHNSAGSGRPIRILSDISNLDKSKINIDTGSLGMTAEELEGLLTEDNIIPELTAGNILMLMSGIGNSREDYIKLAEALKKIAADERRPQRAAMQSAAQSAPQLARKAELFEIPKDKIRIPLADSEGYICAASIIPYPPGIPLICPGEKLTADAIEYVKSLRDSGRKVIGVNENGEITAGMQKTR